MNQLPALAPRLAAVGLLISLAASVACRESAATDEPGTYESAVADAGLVRPHLGPVFDSSEALARAIVDGFRNADGATLASYSLTKEQFRYYVWPQLPSSQGENPLPFDYGWTDLYQKSHNSLLRNFDRFQGEQMEFLELKFEDGLTDYDRYIVHRDARVRVRRADGRKMWIDLFGSIMELDGQYKLFSYVTD